MHSEGDIYAYLLIYWCHVSIIGPSCITRDTFQYRGATQEDFFETYPETGTSSQSLTI
jgi:hypothetical protein